MKKNKILLGTILYCWSILGCSCQRSSYEKTFPMVQDLYASQMSFNEVIKVGDIYKLDNYFILRNIHDNAEYFFYVYSYPEFKYLYSFCRRGNGANEYLMPTVIKNMPGNQFAFRDHATDTYATFLVTDSIATLINQERIPPTDGRFCWEINYVSDEQYVLKRNNSKQSSRELWDLKRNLMLDELPNTFDLANKMRENYYTEFDDYWISVSDSFFAFAYFFIDRIEFGKVEGKKLKLNHFVGTTKTPEFYLFTNTMSGGKFKYNVDNNIVHYETLVSTPHNVYGLYAGIPWGEMEKIHSSLIEVYNWEGTPIKLLKLNESISSFVVDEKNELIYGINPDSHEDAILVFNYN